MTKEILFLTDSSYTDAIAYTAVCYYAQMTKTPVILIYAGANGYVDQLRAELCKEADIILFTNITTQMTYLDPYMMDQCNGRFASVYDVCNKLDLLENPRIASLINLYGSTELYLPSAMAYILFRRIGMIEFSNYVAQKLIEDPQWDIVRDAEVIDTLCPKEPPDDILSSLQ